MRLIGIMFLLLFGVSIQAQVAEQKQYPIKEAKDHNLLLVTKEMNKGVTVVFRDTVGGMMALRQTPSFTYGIVTKGYLPGIVGVTGYGNMSVVKTKYGNAFLTAHHCVNGDRKPKIDERIYNPLVPEYKNEERDLQMTVLLADSFSYLKPLMISEQKVVSGDTCSFGFIHSFYDIQWVYRVIQGPIIELTRSEKKNLFTYKGDAIKVIKTKYQDLLSKVSKKNKRKFLNKSAQVILDFEKKYRTRVNKYKFLCMEISRSTYRELGGASGSALLNKKGEVVGVTSFIWPGEKGKYYVFFSPTYVLNK